MYFPSGKLKLVLLPPGNQAPPSVLYSHVAPGSKPVTFTVSLEVIPSARPVSSASVNIGAVGAVVFTVNVNAGLGSLSLPAASVKV